MNKRIFVQKKDNYNINCSSITQELKNLVPNIECKVFIIYDLFGINNEQFKKTEFNVFADPVTDIVYDDLNKILETNFIDKPKAYFATEYLPGQYNQRSDSAEQCLKLMDIENVNVKTGFLFLLNEINDENLNKIKSYLINPIESREKDLNKLILAEDSEIKKIPIIKGFLDFSERELKQLHKSYSFSMGMDDLLFIQDYFKSLKRIPTETELKILDTYWSDHCRHTTFETEITDIKINSEFKSTIQNTLEYYLNLRKELGITKAIRLMDLATIMGKYLSKSGKVKNIDFSEEINACSIIVNVDVENEGKITEEEWLLEFKNETHNHPTEVEPYGGASTCIGGAIRDPLSGRAFVFQAMRVTGSANPLEKIEDTLESKLPQRKITKEAANGYSSYGNQIGLATTLVKEIYDEGYKAKRMEVGFVAGAVKKKYVRREEPIKGDKIILLGGQTGRDGIGGATGSSKTHDNKKPDELSAEVQKGNAIVERKIQRLFRNHEVLSLIKKCNDFGAGGVSVAIGEIARGIDINLDKIPLKYSGLNGTEIAISESQERMAVVVSDKDLNKFIELANKENLEATCVAEVTDDDKMTMHWKGNIIAELDRKFLDSNGIQKQAKVSIENQENKNPFEKKIFSKENLLNQLEQLNNASQKGLVEMFDNNVGRSTVLNSFGGKYQDSPEDVSVQKLPTDGITQTVSIASFSYNPAISKWSTYHGGYFAVVDSITKIVAGGGKYQDIRLTFQEYFERLKDEPERWGKVFSALLGTIEAQKQFEIPAIGGKDSMSGSYKDIDVPPTLISFSICPSRTDQIISGTIQNNNSRLSVFIPRLKEDFTVDYQNLKDIFEYIKERNKDISSMIAVKFGGISETLSLMSFGNEIGLDIKTDLDLMKYYPFSIIFEHKNEFKIPQNIISSFHKLGKTTNSNTLKFNGIEIGIKEAKQIWKKTLNQVFPEKTETRKLDTPMNFIPINSEITKTRTEIKTKTTKVSEPKVFIPVFPGTNSEYDSIKAFHREGAKISSKVFRNLSHKDIEESINIFSKEINQSQILFIPGGFSAADEPDGSGKFIATVLRSEKIKESIHKLLERDGLVLGICNGFQALIKSGLLPFGEIQNLEANTPTLTFNEIGRHIAQMVKVKVVNENSPWLAGMVGQIYWIPVSHGEGRFIATEEELKKLISNGQIATQYIDLEDNMAIEMPFNPNGSLLGIEGITSPCGKVFGRMGHPERFEEGLMKNIPEMSYMNIFKNGIDYFK